MSALFGLGGLGKVIMGYVADRIGARMALAADFAAIALAFLLVFGAARVFMLIVFILTFGIATAAPVALLPLLVADQPIGDKGQAEGRNKPEYCVGCRSAQPRDEASQLALENRPADAQDANRANRNSDNDTNDNALQQKQKQHLGAILVKRASVSVKGRKRCNRNTEAARCGNRVKLNAMRAISIE